LGDFLNESTLDHGNGKGSAARCILPYFFENFEEEFKEVAHDNNFLLTKGQQKMEPSQEKLCYMSQKLALSPHEPIFWEVIVCI